MDSKLTSIERLRVVLVGASVGAFVHALSSQSSEAWAIVLALASTAGALVSLKTKEEET